MLERRAANHSADPSCWPVDQVAAVVTVQGSRLRWLVADRDGFAQIHWIVLGLLCCRVVCVSTSMSAMP